MKTNRQPILSYLLVTLFIGLKLTGQIDWHWIWILAPLWIYVLATFTAGLVLGTVAGFRARRRRHKLN